MFPHIFCIFAFGISSSFKCMKTILKSHQMVKFKKKNLPCGKITKIKFKVDLKKKNDILWYIIGL